MLYITHLLPIHKLPGTSKYSQATSFLQSPKVRGEWDAIAALQAGPKAVY